MKVIYSFKRSTVCQDQDRCWAVKSYPFYWGSETLPKQEFLGIS